MGHIPSTVALPVTYLLRAWWHIRPGISLQRLQACSVTVNDIDYYYQSNISLSFADNFSLFIFFCFRSLVDSISM